jgi:predicted CDP-diglyceride synthetase/phosphatidate cytidylyltransferase
MCFGLLPCNLHVITRFTDNFLLAFIQVAFLLYKLQYFLILTSINKCKEFKRNMFLEAASSIHVKWLFTVKCFTKPNLLQYQLDIFRCF